MDDFYQSLIKIQKHERSNGNLAKIDETFYNDLYGNFKELKHTSKIDLSFKSQELNKKLIIGKEICERRELKINDAALVNFHRQYSIFLEESELDSVSELPPNLTFLEKKLYCSLINLFKQYREDLISNDEYSSDLYEPNFDIRLSSEHIDNIDSTNSKFNETALESSSLVENLDKIANLYEKGFLTDDEFILVKQRLFKEI